MNTTADGSERMGQDSTANNQSCTYSNEGWSTMSPYSHSPYDGSPMTEYPTFGSYIQHGVPPDHLPRMPSHGQPQPHQPQQHHHQMIQNPTPMGHHQLPMLNTTWPSQLTNPTSSSGSFSAPAVSMPPMPRITAIGTPKIPSQPEKGRKTLTAEQKRAMCQYHEENPGTRQADIGVRFGVERSTVSKVLRHKDQYLRREKEPDPSNLKRGVKTKNPDFDRTLGNYVRRQQQSGFDIKDEEIMEQARLFARASGNQDAILGSLSSSWLQKFKQKHGIGMSPLLRRASETNIPDSNRLFGSHGLRHGTASNEISPASPTQPLSPLSGNRSDDETDLGFTYRQQNSLSTTSLASDIRDNAGSSFSGDTVSPTGTFNFSPDPNIGGFQPIVVRSDATEFQRDKRNNTFPTIDIGYANANSLRTCTEPRTPQQPLPTTGTTSELQSPGKQASPFPINTGVTSPRSLHRSGSNPNIVARSSNSSNPPLTNVNVPLNSAESSPVSPSQEDARRAATTLLNYLQNMGSYGQTFQESDYQAFVQLTKKLQIQPHQSSRPSIGGLSRIPEGDNEGASTSGPAMMQAS